MGKTLWTNAQCQQLTDLWAEGKTAGQIAKIMDITRNAVIGKAHRLELPARRRPPAKKKECKPKNPRGTIPLSELKPNQCIFMGGGFEDKLCCGLEVFDKQMCEKHYRVSYQGKKKHKGGTTKDKMGKQVAV